jgi:hypothetical protein
VPALPWKSFAAPESGKEYTAMLSYLPLNKFRALPKFMRYTYQIRRQLADSGGLVGYSMDADVPRKEFWTLSVWEDDEALRSFVQNMPHGRVMTDLLPDMGQTRFFTSRWTGPPSLRTGK